MFTTGKQRERRASTRRQDHIHAPRERGWGSLVQGGHARGPRLAPAATISLALHALFLISLACFDAAPAGFQKMLEVPITVVRDHDDFGSKRSKVIVIDSRDVERDASGKPVPTFPHRALEPRRMLVFADASEAARREETPEKRERIEVERRRNSQSEEPVSRPVTAEAERRPGAASQARAAAPLLTPAQVSADSGAAPQPSGSGAPNVAQQPGKAPLSGHDFQDLRAVSIPSPADHGTEAMSYKRIILSRLEQAKRFPQSARSRGAHGTAVVRFSLGEAGEVAGVGLLRSSGEPQLDTESLALISRAAPFPPPPPGSQRSFAVDIAFGTGT